MWTTVIVALAATATVSSAFDGARLRDVPVDRCAHGGEMKEGQCECTLNWMGPTCEQEVCQNGGRPTRDREGSVRCSCPFGLKGLRCEKATECQNGGELLDDVCKCRQGFVGVFCQSRPCHHGIPILVPQADEYQCTCDIGYTGTFCDTELLCLNGGSVSSMNTCECVNGFIGEDCNQCEHIVEEGRCVPEVSEMSMAGPSSFEFGDIKLLAMVGGALAITGLLIFAVCCAVRSWRTKPSRTSSAQGSAIVPNPEGTDV